MVARFFSDLTTLISPIFSSWANSSEITFTARSASALLTPMEIVFSEDACEIKKAEMPTLASAPNSRLLTPITPTIPKPCIVTSAASSIEEMPLTG